MIWQILLDIVVLLGAGAALGSLLERWGQSAIVGYLLAGVLLGPNAFHVVASVREVLAVSELGVALLLFVIGLEFSWPRLRSMGRGAVGSGLVQVVTTLALGTAAACLAGLPFPVSLALGSMVALSSTACVMRTLESRGQLEEDYGERALGVLLIQDMAVVPLVLIVSVLSEGGSASDMLASVLRTSAVGAGLVVGLYVTFHFAIPRWLGQHFVRTHRELPLLVAVVSGLGSGVVAHAAGVSPALGAFLAGLLLAESPFAIQVRADVSSLKTLLLTLFFTAVGMLADVGWIVSNAPVFLLCLGGVLVVKAGVVWGALRLFGASSAASMAAAVSLAQVGEFSFVLADIARGRLLDPDLFAGVVSVVVVSMILTPSLVALAPRLAGRSPSTSVAPRPEVPTRDHVVVVGFGPAGRTVVAHVARQGCSVAVVDTNPQAVAEARILGHEGVVGDARHVEVLEHAAVHEATTVVVTVPVTQSALHVVRLVRALAPSTRVVARSRFHRDAAALSEAGAHVVIDEEVETGLRLASALAAERPEEVGGSVERASLERA